MRRFEIVSKEEFTKRLDEKYYANIKIPERKTSKSAGYDFSVCKGDIIKPGEVKVFPTGIKAKMDDSDFLAIFVRSSLGIKKGLMLANNVGIIDSDYYNNLDNEGHIMIALVNVGTKDVEISDGERIAQGIFLKYEVVDNEKEIKAKRLGGIGSTNV